MFHQLQLRLAVSRPGRPRWLQPAVSVLEQLGVVKKGPVINDSSCDHPGWATTMLAADYGSSLLMMLNDEMMLMFNDHK